MRCARGPRPTDRPRGARSAESAGETDRLLGAEAQGGTDRPTVRPRGGVDVGGHAHHRSIGVAARARDPTAKLAAATAAAAIAKVLAGYRACTEEMEVEGA